VIRMSPTKATPLSPLSGTPSKGEHINERDFRRQMEHAQTWHQEKGPIQNASIGNNEERASGWGDCPSKRLKVFGTVKLCGTNVVRAQLLVG
jgi:hypothetical protein